MEVKYIPVYICSGCGETFTEEDFDLTSYKYPLQCTCGNLSFYINLGIKIKKVKESGKEKNL